MYCKHCGETLNQHQSICVRCGVPVGKGNSYCSNCGQVVSAKSNFCKFCGVQLNSINNVHHNEETTPLQDPRYRFLTGSILIAILTTVLWAIPSYYFLYSSTWTDEVYFYSFIEWMEGMSVIPLLLLWAHPILSLIGLKQRKNFGVIKIITSVVLFIQVLAISMGEADGLGAMFFCSIGVLFGQIVGSIVEAITVSVVSKKTIPDRSNYNTSTITVEEPTAATNSIFCRHCGSEMNVNQAVCIKCGVLVGNGNSYCANCGAKVSESADVCIHCGVLINSRKSPNKNTKLVEYPEGYDKTKMALICFFLGGIGVHNFIIGEKKKGYTKIALCFVFGVSGVLALIEFVKILTDKYEVNFETCF